MFDLMDEWGPEKIVAVSDVRTGMRGVLVIDNTARGMGKGGTRMQPSVSVTEVARLARVMTWKWAATDLFYGGAKAGIAADPNSPHKEEILRSFVRALRNEVPEEYVFGLDMGLTENDAAVINDELGRGSAVGTPYELGGMPYDQLGVTGYGVAESIDATVSRLGIKQAGVAIQGFGAVGHAVARRLQDLGHHVVAISTAEGALADPNGLDVDALLAARNLHGDALVHEFADRSIPVGDELFVDADVLVPAAMQDVLSVDDIERVQAKALVEGANLPTSPEAQAALLERGITVVPDFIANAGGVVAAAFAMDARTSAFRPDTDKVMATVAERIRENTETVLQASTDRGITSHEAARTLAQERVRKAMDLRGRSLT
ncbi:Glu/Leu/Phe/Val family dehydrogenase [Propioniferax innocua]|uniref:Glutamate dehydrogenase n=1 Tax=Propioniferax innocua TaxID=1753 RepID=A0A542ZQH1_9ACTN|nr:Glu/Leu/Phe/Val dehydrogenase dimerization domain-containing protein [Propioniferax innocua]TQL62526.1 glutamate dehydrogenase (NADP) [Propioniferax innocua]